MQGDAGTKARADPQDVVPGVLQSPRRGDGSRMAQDIRMGERWHLLPCC